VVLIAAREHLHHTSRVVSFKQLLTLSPHPNLPPNSQVREETDLPDRNDWIVVRAHLREHCAWVCRVRVVIALSLEAGLPRGMMKAHECYYSTTRVPPSQGVALSLNWPLKFGVLPLASTGR
jgi:hypothetical protein